MSIFHGTRHIHGPRRDEGDQHVLIHRKQFLAIVVLAEVAAKPVWKVRVDEADRFAEHAFAQRSTAAA